MGEADRLVSATAVTDTPYVGLSYYTEDRADAFFGRDAERTMIIGNLRAARLTLLYAESGVGKSSLLRAGVASRLRELAYRSLAERGSAGYVPVVFSSWRDEPVEELIDEVTAAIGPFLSNGSVELPRERLEDAIEAAASVTDATLLVILDQFEEYFLYSCREARSGRFADDLARCIGRSDLRANFLIAVREDAYAGLGDLFKGQIANVYANYLHLEYLDREAAREAIIKPIQHHNAVHDREEPVTIEPELVEAVLDQVRTGQVMFEQEGQGVVIGRNGATENREEIETPYLQLVMTTLWEHERSAGSRVLRRLTLEELGDAQEIIRTHLDSALSGLPDEERETAVDVFHHLVTPSGTKIVHRIPDLAAYAGRAPAEVEALVDKLTSGKQRILRRVPAPAGEDGKSRVEIFHDVLAPAILAWRSRQNAVRLGREKQAAEDRAHRERRRARVFRALAAISFALLIIAVVAIVLARVETSRAQRSQRTAVSYQLARQALTDLQNGALGRGVLLGTEAYRYAHTTDARLSLIRALEATQAMEGYLPGYTAAVTSVAFSPNGKVLACGSADGSVVLEDETTGRRLRVLHGHETAVSNVAFNPDGTILASASADASVILWDVATGHPSRTLTGHAGAVNGVAFSPDGTILASANVDKSVILWDPSTGRRLRTLRGHTAIVNDVAFSPDRKTLASASDDHTAVLWNIGTGRRLRTLRGHTGKVNGVVFAPDGRTLASASDDRTVIVWSAGTGREIHVLRGHTSFVDDIAFSPDGTTIASAADDHAVILWDAHTGRQLRELRGHAAAVDSVAFSPSGSLLASGGQDDLVIVWYAKPPLLQRTLAGHHDAVLGLAVSPDGRLLASAGQDNTVILWDARTGKRLRTLRGHTNAVEAVAFGPDGRILASASADKTVILWDVVAGRLSRVLRGHSDYVYGVAFSSDGHTVASASADDSVILWDANSGQRLHTLHGHTDYVSAVAFSPDGRTLASASADKSIVLWDVATGRRLRTLIGHTGTVESVAFSPNGRELASASLDGTVILWNAKTGRQLGDPFSGHNGAVTSVAFARGGRTVASGGSDQSVIVWDVASRLGEPYVVQTGTISSVAFSPDGRTIASGSVDHTVALAGPVPLSTQSQDVYQRLCGVVRRNLTRPEWNEFAPGQDYHKACPTWP